MTETLWIEALFLYVLDLKQIYFAKSPKYFLLLWKLFIYQMKYVPKDLCYVDQHCTQQKLFVGKTFQQ